MTIKPETTKEVAPAPGILTKTGEHLLKAVQAAQTDLASLEKEILETLISDNSHNSRSSVLRWLVRFSQTDDMIRKAEKISVDFGSQIVHSRFMFELVSYISDGTGLLYSDEEDLDDFEDDDESDDVTSEQNSPTVAAAVAVAAAAEA